MPIINIVEKITLAKSVKEMSQAIDNVTTAVALAALKDSAEHITQEVEFNLAAKHTQLAMWNLAKLDAIENLISQVERSHHGIISLEEMAV